MAVRTVSEMMSEVRDNTNNTNKSRFTDTMLLRFFDSASRTIQTVLYNAYPQDMIFYDCKDIDLEANKVLYNLPSNMLNGFSIYTVLPVRQDGTKSDALHRLSPQEENQEHGYIIAGKKIRITPNSLVNLSSLTKLRISYAKKWARIDDLNQAPEIDEILEEYMTMFVERKIHYVDSSKDIMNSNVFTQEEKIEMIKMYADAARDPKYVPTGSDTYINY